MTTDHHPEDKKKMETMTASASGSVTAGDRRAELAAHTPGPWVVAAAPDMLRLARAVALYFQETDSPLGNLAREIVAKAEGKRS